MKHTKREKWIMPDWIKPFEKSITNTGGNSVTNLMNQEPADVFSNAPLALIQMSVEAQISFLHRAKANNLLANPEGIKELIEAAKEALNDADDLRELPSMERLQQALENTTQPKREE